MHGSGDGLALSSKDVALALEKLEKELHEENFNRLNTLNQEHDERIHRIAEEHKVEKKNEVEKNITAVKRKYLEELTSTKTHLEDMHRTIMETEIQKAVAETLEKKNAEWEAKERDLALHHEKEMERKAEHYESMHVLKEAEQKRIIDDKWEEKMLDLENKVAIIRTFNLLPFTLARKPGPRLV